MIALTMKNLKIRAWRQFGLIDLDFHPRVTIITGANGAGKSTIISIISRHFGYSKNLLATPRKEKKGSFFSTGLFNIFRKKDIENSAINNSESKIGSIEYSNNVSSDLMIPTRSGIHYNVQPTNQQAIHGIHIDSHRPPIIYRGISQLNLIAPNIRSFFNGVNSELSSYFASGGTPKGTLFHIKTSLIAMSIFGHGNPTMEARPELLSLFTEFEQKLKAILPKSLGFQRLEIQSPEVILKTKSGDFILDAASGGILKLIVIVWQIFFFSKTKEKERFIVTMDEPENHLHPSMQREFLGNFVNAFPNAQFIIATHSPFVVSSIRESFVYVLKYENTEILEEAENENVENASFATKVFSKKLDIINKSGTASEILRNVLGLTTTIPDWVEDRIDDIISEYKNARITPEVLNSIQTRLNQEGLSTQYPQVIQALVKS